MTPSIVHHGITLQITDQLTFEMARLLWKDICKEFEKPELLTIPIKATSDPVLVIEAPTGPATGSGCAASPPVPESQHARLSVCLGGSGYKFIKNAKSPEECYEKFPNVPREDLERIWKKHHPDTQAGKIKQAVRSATEGRINNLDNGRWTDPELASISTCANVKEAIKAYHEKFPESSRNDNAVEQKFNKLKLKPPIVKGAKPPVTAQPDKEPTKVNDQPTLVQEARVADTKAFFVGAQVKQIAGTNPAFGTGDITKIHPNGSITVEFYDQTRTLRPEELDFYHKGGA